MTLNLNVINFLSFWYLLIIILKIEKIFIINFYLIHWVNKHASDAATDFDSLVSLLFIVLVLFIIFKKRLLNVLLIQIMVILFCISRENFSFCTILFYVYKAGDLKLLLSGNPSFPLWCNRLRTDPYRSSLISGSHPITMALTQWRHQNNFKKRGQWNAVIIW